MSPVNGVSNELLNTIEDQIAEILNGRSACSELELFVRRQLRRGYIEPNEAEDLIDLIDTVRLGLKRGQRFGKRVRGNPEIL